MPTLIHASDIHFGRPHLPAAAEAFLRAVQEVGPDGIVISGDLTQRAKREEFAEAASFLKRLPDVPVVVTPGNHDVPLYRVFERLFTPYRNYREFIDERLNTITRMPGATVVALNTAAPRTAIVNGRLKEEQLRFAEDAFAETPEADLRIMVCHHHLAPAPDYEGDKALPNARRILTRFQDMGVEMTLGGHLHRAYIGNSLDVLPGADPERGVIIVQSGTTTSARGRARERMRCSFNVIHIAEEIVQVEHRHLDAETDVFRPTSLHTFARRPRRSLPDGVTRAEAHAAEEHR